MPGLVELSGISDGKAIQVVDIDEDDVEDLDATNQDWRSDTSSVGEITQKTNDVKLLIEDDDDFGDDISRFTVDEGTLTSESSNVTVAKNKTIPKLAPTFGFVPSRFADTSSSTGEVAGIHRHHSLGERYNSIPLAKDFYSNNLEVGTINHANKLFIGNLGLDRLQFTKEQMDQFCSDNPNNSTKHDSVVLKDTDLVR